MYSVDVLNVLVVQPANVTVNTSPNALGNGLA